VIKPKPKSKANTMESLPPNPTTFQMLCESIPVGVAGLLSKSIDDFGKNNPEVISEAILFYETNSEIMTDLTVIERRKTITDHLRDKFISDLVAIE
jgi:hypothetical protein